jgi:hypothetical protein
MAETMVYTWVRWEGKSFCSFSIRHLFRAESDQNSSHPCALPFSVDNGAGVKIAMSSLLPTQTAHHYLHRSIE